MVWPVVKTGWLHRMDYTSQLTCKSWIMELLRVQRGLSSAPGKWLPSDGSAIAITVLYFVEHHKKALLFKDPTLGYLNQKRTTDTLHYMQFNDYYGNVLREALRIVALGPSPCSLVRLWKQNLHKDVQYQNSELSLSALKALVCHLSKQL